MFSLCNGSVKYYVFQDGFSYDNVYYRSTDEMTKRLAGGLVVCQRVEDDRGGRLRLHKIYVRNSIERGNGWYDLFTYTQESEELQAGFYLCRIKEFKVDKNNYVNMVVTTVTFLGESITAEPEDGVVKIVRTLMLMDDKEDMPAWQFLKSKMSPIAFAPHGEFFGRFNQENAEEHGFTAEAVMDRIVNGDVAVLSELSELLKAPNKAEQAMEYVRKNYRTPEFESRYPLFAKKLQNKGGKDIFPVIEKHLKDFEEKGLEVDIPEGASVAETAMYKVEAALKYWKEIHKAQKAQKNKKGKVET